MREKHYSIDKENDNDGDSEAETNNFISDINDSAKRNKRNAKSAPDALANIQGGDDWSAFMPTSSSRKTANPSSLHANGRV